MEWKVDHNPSVVVCERITQFLIYVPDGAVSSDAQVISRYILETAKDKEQDRLLLLAEKGLLTVVTVQKTAVTVPPVPAPHPAPHEIDTLKRRGPGA
jgi:hypothetical protein